MCDPRIYERRPGATTSCFSKDSSSKPNFRSSVGMHLRLDRERVEAFAPYLILW
jgi:hypothetical protein